MNSNTPFNLPNHPNTSATGASPTSPRVGTPRRRSYDGRLHAVAFSAALIFSPLALASSLPGYTEPYKIITVSAAESGVIAELLVGEGSIVKKGEVLARLDTAVHQAELEGARAEAKVQETRKQRLEELKGSGKATPEELEKARTDLTIRQAQVRKVEAMIENRTLRSPVDGVVTELKRDLSEAVSPTQSQVLTVVQIDRLTVNLFLNPERASKFKVGDTAHISLSEMKDVATAKVEFVSPVTDAASRSVRVKFVIENADGKYRAGTSCSLAE